MTYDTWLGTCTAITQGAIAAAYIDLEGGGYIITEGLTPGGAAGHRMAVNLNGGEPCILVDRTSASMVCALHRQLNTENAAQLAAMPFYLALELTKQASADGVLEWTAGAA
ncbi:hypothetical protein [Deinococcus soli (ex Cha et al. 2016)]|uniref:Uncharacterized protein n=2 Tax=Deinococcus soli (ex Cha et al. 2016) TaxID=1309411 RepID=A0ACC6KHC3_9DEIO|nr:hypothetical protein [Deinococcus soli (ex Cha et al. 2016)]MDR6218915.1 hypothetical protein [Deinococcus soli (ex Cha et al. 2016)]MDR6328712.1 hypothetical protein [Deinococcus soli (ex Cha et al. 2016)]MDR6751801.1 hypothetical protein [Deinococcus soli (ex Cha et al. 2016)]